MELLNIIGLLILACIFWLFWQTRVMAELAKNETERYGEKYGLQILALARTTLKPSRNEHGRFCWKASYQFEFSSDGESYYVGHIVINGNRIISIETSAYRQPSDTHSGL
ncbi:MAG: DUF3301 domain-containing protein [Psychrobium sp.]